MKADQTSESLTEDKTIGEEDDKKETKKDKKQLLIQHSSTSVQLENGLI